MDKNIQIPSYEEFLEALDYSPELVDKYFSGIIESLEKELLSLRDSDDAKYSELYENFQEKVNKYDSIREDILRKYLLEYQDINESYLTDLITLEAKNYEDVANVEEKIKLEKEVLRKMEGEYLQKQTDLTKVSRTKIKEIEDELSRQYELHANAIFQAKDTVVKEHEEYYSNVESHLKEIDKLIRFFKELKEFFGTLTPENLLSDPVQVTEKIDIYLSYIKENRDAWSEATPLLGDYKALISSFEILDSESDKRLKSSRDEAIEIKKNIAHELNKIKDTEDVVNSHFDEAIQNEKFAYRKKILEKEKSAFLKQLTNERVKLSLESTASIDLINKEAESLRQFHESLINLTEGVKSIYETKINDINTLMIESISQLESILSDAKTAVETTYENYSTVRNTIIYYKNRYRSLEVDTKLESLTEYKEYLEKNVIQNKELDTLAFELLTIDEVLELKLLELKKEFLTVDEKLKIKKVAYDLSIERMKESFETELQIENAKDEIRLLQKDLKIDRQIKKKELDNKVKLLDERKDVDLLRCDYMAAYARLDNVQGLIDIKSSSEDKISELESQIKVQKIIEISLYECISRKREFEHFIDKYNNEVQKLDTEVQAKKRYQNDILEIERNKFEEDRAKNESDRQDERKEYYPEILDIKNKSQKKINDLKNAFDSSSDDEKKEKVEKEEKVREALLRHRKLYQKTIKLIDGSHKKEKGSSSYFNMIDTSSFTDQIISILDNYANEANAILKELFNHEGMENPKLPGKTKFEKSMRKAKKDNEREKAYAQLQKDAKASLNKSKSTFSSIVQEEMPMTDKETDKYLKEYNEVKKTLIAEEAIRANDELAPYLEKLENIEKERDKKVEANKQHLEDYKKQYTDTIKAIEEDYQSKIDELNKLKEERENERQSENADVRQLIKESTDKIAELTDKENQANKEFIDSTSRDRQNKVQSLSDEISEINRELDNKKAQLDKDNQAFRDQKSIEAKANIEKYNLEKTKNDQQLKNKIKQMEKERDSRFRSMDSDTLAIKIAYNERVEKLIEQTENIKADKELRFGELLDETKNDTISAYEKVRKPVDEFSKSMDLLNEEIINRTISLTNTVLENESSSFEEIVNEVDSSINGKEGA